MNANQEFKNFMAIVITTMLFGLWFLPHNISLDSELNGWGVLYLPILLLNILWGNIIKNYYFKY